MNLLNFHAAYKLFIIKEGTVMDLVLNTSQKLLLSQKMLLSTEILQMSSAELVDYIKEMSVENPVVEYEENNDVEETFDIIRKKIDFINSHDEQNKTYYMEEKEDENNNDDWRFTCGKGESLEEHLTEQLDALTLEKDVYKGIKYMILSMDKNGYISESIEEMSYILKVSEDKLTDALLILQNFEPVGVGARTIEECLLLQLKNLPKRNAAAEKIAAQYLDLVGKNQIHTIEKKLKLSQPQILEAIKIIKSLNPKPGNCFSTGESFEYITPDAIIHKTDKGYEIILNDKFFPTIGISSYYKNIMDTETSEKTKEYILKKIKQAQWVMSCIEKRNETLTKTLETIISIQQDFFDLGCDHIKPLRLEDVAVAISMHESTVSRTIKNKYLQCRHGVFPLSYFFPSAVSTENNENITPQQIQLIIKEIVDGENHSSPFSDREITELLEKRGIVISRRTVAKYREVAGILSTSGRKCKI